MPPRVKLEPLNNIQSKALNNIENNLAKTKVAPLPNKLNQEPQNTEIFKKQEGNIDQPGQALIDSEIVVDSTSDFKLVGTKDNELRSSNNHTGDLQCDVNYQQVDYTEPKAKKMVRSVYRLRSSVYRTEKHWTKWQYRFINTPHARKIYRYPQTVVVSLAISHILSMAIYSAYLYNFWTSMIFKIFVVLCLVAFPFRSFGYIYYGDPVSSWLLYKVIIFLSLCFSILLMSASFYYIEIFQEYLALALAAALIAVTSYNIAERCITCTSDHFTYQRIMYTSIRVYRVITVILDTTVIASFAKLVMWWAVGLSIGLMLVDLLELYYFSLGSPASKTFYVFWAFCETAFCCLAVVSFVDQVLYDVHLVEKQTTQLVALKIAFSFLHFLYHFIKLLPQDKLPNFMNEEKIVQYFKRQIGKIENYMVGDNAFDESSQISDEDQTQIISDI